VVHLAVLVGRTEPVFPDVCEPDEDLDVDLDAEFLDENGVSRWWATAPPTETRRVRTRAAELIAAGVGRRRLSKELGVSEYEARQLLQRTRSPQPEDGDEPSSVDHEIQEDRR
jgi:hypothetical protein